MEKELCDCGNIATWSYMPGFSDKSNPHFCDDCVSRGCECNHHHVSDGRSDAPVDDKILMDGNNRPIKWIEPGKTWCAVDEQGREFPCCEYWYEEDGWDKEN